MVDFGGQWQIDIGSPVVTNVSLWYRVLIMREAVHGRGVGGRVFGNSVYFLFNVSVNLKLL